MTRAYVTTNLRIELIYYSMSQVVTAKLGFYKVNKSSFFIAIFLIILIFIGYNEF